MKTRQVELVVRKGHGEAPQVLGCVTVSPSGRGRRRTPRRSGLLPGPGGSLPNRPRDGEGRGGREAANHGGLERAPERVRAREAALDEAEDRQCQTIVMAIDAGSADATFDSSM